MNCYSCKTKIKGNRIQCPECGADLTLYRKIIFTSNRYYNQALERARVRNLTSALDLLEQSIQLNSENYKARNLKGLILYEMGEIADAVTEWTISEKIKAEDNFASQFLSQVTTSVDDLNSDYNLIRKYNQVVEYIHTDAKDLAVIQLKKIIGLRPGMVKAYLLLALLYMENKEYDKARSVLKDCKKYDVTNPKVELYLREVRQLNPRKKKREVLDDEPKNEVIIPVRMWDFGTYLTTALYIFAGMILAFGVLYYIVIPEVKSQYAAENQANLNTYQATRLEDKEEIRRLEEQIQKLTDEKDDITKDLSVYTQSSEDVVTAYNELIQLLVAYGTRNVPDMITLSGQVNSDVVQTDAYQNAYNLVINYINNDLFNELYNTASAAREATSQEGIQPGEARAQWEIAVVNYENCRLMQPDNPEVIYYLGNAYQGIGDVEKAKECYDRIVADFVDTEYYGIALQLLQQIAGVVPEGQQP